MTETALAIGHVLGSPLLATRCHQNQNGYRAMSEGPSSSAISGWLLVHPKPKVRDQKQLAESLWLVCLWFPNAVDESSMWVYRFVPSLHLLHV
jgi:hypothetical protein